jgi:hypothetical protein
VVSAGSNVAYNANFTAGVNCLALDGAGADIATKMVPAGSYIIFSTVPVANLDEGGPQTASCTLSSPDNPSFVTNIALVRLPQDDIPKMTFVSGCGDIRQGQGNITQQITAVLSMPTTLNLHCNQSQTSETMYLP